jgi:hypothetical protein
VQPLKQANEEVTELTEKKKKYDKIMDDLEVQKHAILEQERIYKDLEWEYEVRLQ